MGGGGATSPVAGWTKVESRALRELAGTEAVGVAGTITGLSVVESGRFGVELGTGSV